MRLAMLCCDVLCYAMPCNLVVWWAEQYILVTSVAHPKEIRACLELLQGVQLEIDKSLTTCHSLAHRYCCLAEHVKHTPPLENKLASQEELKQVQR